LCGFIGEVFVVLSVWKFSIVMAVIAASVVILTAGYILWAIQRVYLGAEYKGPHEEALLDIGGGAGKAEGGIRELAIAGTLFVFAILFGVFPHTFALQFMDATIDRQVEQLTDWTKQHDIEEVQANREAREKQDQQAAVPPATLAPQASVSSTTPAVLAATRLESSSVPTSTEPTR
jgi:NADH-quinone oxidoreductase subunit M